MGPVDVGCVHAVCVQVGPASISGVFTGCEATPGVVSPGEDWLADVPGTVAPAKAATNEVSTRRMPRMVVVRMGLSPRPTARPRTRRREDCYNNHGPASLLSKARASQPRSRA